MNLHSYHIFYFPFRWYLPCEENKILSDQIDLKHIPVSGYSMWERVQIDQNERTVPMSEKEIQEARELFGERQYFFEFVHPVLYDIKGVDKPLINHYERREPKGKNVHYQIKVKNKKKEKEYCLRVDAMNLNLYSTGVGILSFYLANEKDNQNDESSVRDINQFGRRIMPPHSGEFGVDRGLMASYIKISGLEGSLSNYYEDTFDYKELATGDERGLDTVWRPAYFIESLIKDLSPELKVVPVIDDRMLVNCWYGSDELSAQVKYCGQNEGSEFVKGNFWYKYSFIDAGDSPNDDTCQNDSMKERLLQSSTYFRWQKQGTLYGVSRYSLVALTDRSDFALNVLGMHMRTIYSRMFELIIVQRASMLRFAAEVTKVSGLAGSSHKDVALRINSLYKEYIRFVNQIYFRSVTVQDQGIELYDMMMNQFASHEQIKDLDDEIEELHRYVMLLVDQSRSVNGEKLNKLAAFFLPATVLAAIFGMNRFRDLAAQGDFWIHLGIIIIITIIAYSIIKKWRN